MSCEKLSHTGSPIAEFQTIRCGWIFCYDQDVMFDDIMRFQNIKTLVTVTAGLSTHLTFEVFVLRFSKNYKDLTLKEKKVVLICSSNTLTSVK